MCHSLIIFPKVAVFIIFYSLCDTSDSGEGLPCFISEYETMRRFSRWAEGLLCICLCWMCVKYQEKITEPFFDLLCVHFFTLNSLYLHQNLNLRKPLYDTLYKSVWTLISFFKTYSLFAVVWISGWVGKLGVFSPCFGFFSCREKSKLIKMHHYKLLDNVHSSHWSDASLPNVRTSFLSHSPASC